MSYIEGKRKNLEPITPKLLLNHIAFTAVAALGIWAASKNLTIQHTADISAPAVSIVQPLNQPHQLVETPVAVPTEESISSNELLRRLATESALQVPTAHLDVVAQDATQYLAKEKELQTTPTTMEEDVKTVYLHNNWQFEQAEGTTVTLLPSNIQVIPDWAKKQFSSLEKFDQFLAVEIKDSRAITVGTGGAAIIPNQPEALTEGTVISNTPDIFVLLFNPYPPSDSTN